MEQQVQMRKEGKQVQNQQLNKLKKSPIAVPLM
jgi:hypothetical protein